MVSEKGRGSGGGSGREPLIDGLLKSGDQGPVVILVHGVGGAARYWAPQLDALSDRWRLFAWDIPGYGSSPPLDRMTFASLSRRLLEVIVSILGDHAGNGGKVTLVGHSLGGMIAQDFAASHPELIDRLVLSGTSPAFGRPDGDWQKQFLAQRLGPLDRGRTMTDLAASLVEGLVGDDPDPAGVDLAVSCMGAVSPRVYRQSMECLVTFDRREALARIAAPTLLIAGEKDANAPAEMMRKMAAKIGGSRFAVIGGAGHLASVERPRDFNALVRCFLSETEQGEPTDGPSHQT